MTALLRHNFWLFLFGISFVTVGLGVAIFYRPVVMRAGAISLDAPITNLDLGTVGQYESREAKFLVKNTTGEQIELIQFHPTCACLQQASDRDKLMPGETATIVVVWKMGSARGTTTNSVGVTWGLVGKPEVTNTIYLTASAVIEPDYIVEPEVIRFDKSMPGEIVIRVRDGRKAGIKIFDAKSINSAIVVRRLDSNSISVTYKPDKYQPNPDMLSDIISIYFEHPSEPIFTVPCEVR